MPGTWALSAQGAKAAAGEYIELILLTAIVVAVAVPYDPAPVVLAPAAGLVWIP